MFYITHGIVNVPLPAYIRHQYLRDQSSLIMWENFRILLPITAFFLWKYSSSAILALKSVNRTFSSLPEIHKILIACSQYRRA